MDNNEPNKIVASLYKEYKVLKTSNDYPAIENLKDNLRKIAVVTGSIAVMSKINILRLIRMQTTFNFLPDHRFYRIFAIALEDIEESKK